MPLPRIAIVGRPNVGKSSLLNRLARRRVSIIAPTPGVTRDRVSTLIELDPPADGDGQVRLVELTDTGGYGVYTVEGGRYNEIGADLTTLTDAIESQIQTAIGQSDLILFVVDAQAGLSALDQQIAEILRRRTGHSEVLLVANKVDSESWIADAAEASSLGFGAPLGVSAQNAFGIVQLLEVLYQQTAGLAHDQVADDEMKIAILGKRNAGKSTLINALAGAPRVIVSEIAGTTRDAVDVRFEIDGRTMTAIDTAGVRKRKSFADEIEHYAYQRMLESMRRADVAMLLVDATQEVSQVDKKLSDQLQESYKPTVIVVNKWDQVDQSVSTSDYLQYLTEQLRGLDYAPIAFISAQQGEGLRDVVGMAFNLHQQASHRVATSELNDVTKAILKQRGPSSRLGTQAKLLYVTQVDIHPPTIVLVVNEPDLFRGQYERYLLNKLRDELPFSEVPIRLVFSKRKRRSLSDLKTQGRQREKDATLPPSIAPGAVARSGGAGTEEPRT
jgi:GTP-binding protein